MTASTARSITRTAERSLKGSEYGCLRARANVPWPVVTLFLLTVVILLLFSVYGLVLFVWLHRFKRRTTDAVTLKSLLKYTPNDLVGWMRHATSENPSSVSSVIRARELVHWSISAVPGPCGTRLGVVRREKSSVELDDALSIGSPSRVAVDDRSPTLISDSPMPEQKQIIDSNAGEADWRENEGVDQSFLVKRKPLGSSGGVDSNGVNIAPQWI